MAAGAACEAEAETGRWPAASVDQYSWCFGDQERWWGTASEKQTAKNFSQKRSLTASKWGGKESKIVYRQRRDKPDRENRKFWQKWMVFAVGSPGEARDVGS
jgi:hypothetical protein